MSYHRHVLADVLVEIGPPLELGPALRALERVVVYVRVDVRLERLSLGEDLFALSSWAPNPCERNGSVNLRGCLYVCDPQIPHSPTPRKMRLASSHRSSIGPHSSREIPPTSTLTVRATRLRCGRCHGCTPWDPDTHETNMHIQWHLRTGSRFPFFTPPMWSSMMCSLSPRSCKKTCPQPSHMQVSAGSPMGSMAAANAAVAAHSHQGPCLEQCCEGPNNRKPTLGKGRTSLESEVKSCKSERLGSRPPKSPEPLPGHDP